MMKKSKITAPTVRYTQAERKRVSDRVFITTLVVNSLLMCGKFLAGIFGHSPAMISDAIHTLSDVGTTVLAMFGVRFAAKREDAGHPYGHQKIESVTGLILSFVLAMTALMIGKSGVETLLAGKDAFVQPGLIAVIAAGVSILTQEALFQLAYRGGVKIDSTAMKADAWHHRSDALSSIGALVGIGAARFFGLWYMDAAASLLICLLILWTAAKIFRDCVNQLIDASAPPEELKQIERAITEIDGVMHIDCIRSRLHGDRLYVDVEISVLRDTSFERAHEICEQVHRHVEQKFEKVLDCTVHANPDSYGAAPQNDQPTT